MPAVTTVRTVADLRSHVAKWRKEGERVALVPTMGALHAGHLSLVTLARGKADRVVVSIFINPIQFGPREDFKTYPRQEASDLDKLAKAGADLVFVPDGAEMYPEGFSTRVKVFDLTDDLCGAARPNHFEGVATVVTKLLLQAGPDLAVFGEKDYQQLLVVRRLVRDLNIPVEIVGAPIVREEDGLALSSRNVYLSPAERKTAPLLYRTISEVAANLAKGEGADAAALAGRFKLEAAGFRIDYVAVRDPETLKPLSGPVKPGTRVLAAAYLGKTRLIDNVAVSAKA
ncbi:pantoate--beta-alanine ligase [Methyloceanibacter sp.]|uniref:pantoate--beta-alanine ligase n=1 Tax=Methyloceanibacter sp. TaxID=1965321 RepID=UPI002D543D5E|nr:pantoate--beta-alanine ligase [Methyloceanibacter sp.]HZP08623.1 pantoate--beta-alanine ligase [Methyloceanibacter sp.]